MRIRFALTASALALASLTACAGPAVIEDDPRWDCNTMGNRLCGPASDAERGYAWAVWDRAGGASKLRVDPARPYSVEYVGSATEYPRIGEYDLALVGRDSKWYVFRAAYTG